MLRPTTLFLNRGPFARGAAILLVTSFLSYALGLLRDRVLAGTFGASDALDAYQAAFILPDFIFNLFLAGALSVAFLPVFTDFLTKKKPREAAALAGSLLTWGLLILTAVAVIAWLLADLVTPLISPGFAADKQALQVSLSRLLLLSPLIFLASNLLGSMLIAKKNFLYYGLSPALYNLGIIGGILVLAPSFGIAGAAVGTIIGASLHLLCRLVGLHRSGLKITPNLGLTPAARKVVRLMLPRVIHLTAVQVQLWAYVAIASTLGEGAVSIYNLARNFQSFPVSLIGIAFATSLFPLLAASASRRELSRFNQHLYRAALSTAAIIVPAALAIYWLREPIVSLFVGTGSFDETAVARTAAVLGVYTLSIPTESLVHIFARGFYALHNTLIPVAISLLTIATSISSAYLLAPSLGISSLPAGFALGTAIQLCLLIVILRRFSARALA